MEEKEINGTPTLDEIDDLLEETPEDTDESVKENVTEDEELDLDLDFLGKPTRLKKSEARTAIQKGLNYDHVLEKQHKAEEELNLLKAQIQKQDIERQKNEIKQKLIDEGYDGDAITDAINNHPAIKAAEDILLKSTRQIDIDKQILELKEKRFFKDVEPEIKQLMQANQNLDAVTAYRFVVGGQIDELIEKEKSHTEKETIANIHDKQKRGTSMVGDSAISEIADPSKILDKSSLDMTNSFGNDPKKIAQYVQTQTKNRR